MIPRAAPRTPLSTQDYFLCSRLLVSCASLFLVRLSDRGHGTVVAGEHPSRRGVSCQSRPTWLIIPTHTSCAPSCPCAAVVGHAPFVSFCPSRTCHAPVQGAGLRIEGLSAALHALRLSARRDSMHLDGCPRARWPCANLFFTAIRSWPVRANILMEYQSTGERVSGRGIT